MLYIYIYIYMHTHLIPPFSQPSFGDLKLFESGAIR